MDIYYKYAYELYILLLSVSHHVFAIAFTIFKRITRDCIIS
jgi:hypothetical protein